MAKFFKRNEAIQAIRVLGAAEAVLFLLQEQVDHAEKELLGMNPNHTDMRDRLVKAQSYRLLLTTLQQDLK